MLGHMKVEKTSIDVEVFFTSGDSFQGCFYLKAQQRVSDLLNDERSFIPFQILGGALMLVRKESITRVLPLENKDAHLTAGSDRAALDAIVHIDRREAIALLGLGDAFNHRDVTEKYSLISRHLTSLPVETDYFGEKLKAARDLLLASLRLDAM